MPFFSKITWLFRRIKIYALVGKSGSGKSFRAHLLMEKYGIELLIDDGLLIEKNKIIAGKSAKRASNPIEAVGVAIFESTLHRLEIKKALRHLSFKRILILGTSKRMIDRITTALDLPSPYKIVTIEDVASDSDIKTAIEHRTMHGSHVIPVPAIEVRKRAPNMLVHSLEIIVKKGFGIFHRKKAIEKSLVRPQYGNRGKIQISSEALSQMTLHCVHEFDSEIIVQKFRVDDLQEGYEIELFVSLPYNKPNMKALPDLQQYIADHIEQYTGIFIKKLDIIIDKLDRRDTNS